MLSLFAFVFSVSWPSPKIVYSFIELQNASVIQTKRIMKNGEAFWVFIATKIEDDGIEPNSHYC